MFLVIDDLLRILSYFIISYFFVICVDRFMIIEVQNLPTFPMLKFDNISWQSLKILFILVATNPPFPIHSLECAILCWNFPKCLHKFKPASIDLLI